MIARKFLSFSLLQLLALSMSTKVYSQVEDEKTIVLREELGIDYSMPDFSTSKVDGKVIGTRLANMLELLKRQGHNYIYSHQLVIICCEKHENLYYANLEKFSIKRITKQGDVITIIFRLKLGDNSAGIRTTDVPVVFAKGISPSQAANNLFTNLARYIKEE